LSHDQKFRKGTVAGRVGNMIVIGVHSTYWNRGIRNHRRKSRKIWMVYELDEDGKLHTRHVSSLMVPYYKTQVHKRRRAVCLKCGNEYVVLIKNDKQIFETECPNCNDFEAMLLPCGLENDVAD
jgi:hypothetical protein